jgi:hypothetical protein
VDCPLFEDERPTGSDCSGRRHVIDDSLSGFSTATCSAGPIGEHDQHAIARGARDRSILPDAPPAYDLGDVNEAS